VGVCSLVFLVYTLFFSNATCEHAYLMKVCVLVCIRVASI